MHRSVRQSVQQIRFNLLRIPRNAVIDRQAVFCNFTCDLLVYIQQHLFHAAESTTTKTLMKATTTTTTTMKTTTITISAWCMELKTANS